MEKQFPALNRTETENHFKAEVKPSASKRKVVNVVNRSRPRRNAKRARIASSSDDSIDHLFSPKDSSDSEEEYVPVKKLHSSNGRRSSEDTKPKSKKDESMDESDFYPESETSGEEPTSSDLTTPSEDSDSESKKQDKTKTKNRKSKVKCLRYKNILSSNIEQAVRRPRTM